MDNIRRGKFIVIYGINNLGKTTQAKMLVEKLKLHGLAAEYIKYPIYSITPSGQILNNYLRNNNPSRLSPREIQIIYAFNRHQYEKILLQKLAQGVNIVAEDYTGTGIAWGMAYGLN
jgi:thymidylate kinase